MITLCHWNNCYNFSLIYTAVIIIVLCLFIYCYLCRLLDFWPVLFSTTWSEHSLHGWRFFRFVMAVYLSAQEKADIFKKLAQKTALFMYKIILEHVMVL